MVEIFCKAIKQFILLFEYLPKVLVSCNRCPFALWKLFDFRSRGCWPPMRLYTQHFLKTRRFSPPRRKNSPTHLVFALLNHTKAHLVQIFHILQDFGLKFLGRQLLRPSTWKNIDGFGSWRCCGGSTLYASLRMLPSCLPPFSRLCQSVTKF